MPPGVYDKESPESLRHREDLDNPDSKDNQAADDPSDPRNVGEQEQRVGRGYVEDGKASLKGSGLSRRKKWLLAGIGSSVVALIIAFMFGFLGIFKLEHIMSNVDAKVHARMLGVVDGRSRRWMRAYLEVRLMDIGDGKLNLNAGDKSDNVFFRSEKVQRGNPMFNWYRTMRLSNFEAEVFEKNGFKFTSFYYYDEVSGQVRTRTAKISLNDRVLAELDIPENIRASIEAGDIKAMREYPDLIKLEERFDNDRDARRAIRKMVNEDIPSWRIFLRRHVRKDIQNVNGVRDWRFFEKTRQAVHEKKIEIRNKILAKAIPSNFKSGQILRCLFGVDNCRYSRDVYDPANRDEGVRSNGSGSQKAEENFKTDVDDNAKPLIDEEGKPKLDTRTANPTQISDDAAKLAARLGTKIGGSLNAFTAAVNITGTLEMLSQVNQAIPKLAKMAVIAKGAQAMGLFQVFETSRDQTKSGELTADEYNELMRVLNTPTQSEGWHKVIEGNDTNPKNANKTKAEYCEDRYVPTDKDFHYLCDDKKIGDASNAEGVQNKYNSGIGKAIGPIVEVYEGAKGTPILGSVIKVLNKITEAVGELLSKAILGAASVVGLGDDIKSALTWVMGKLAVFLGAGPILSEDGSEKAGEYVNLVIQGGAYTAETAARGSGAAKTTEASKATSITTLNKYRQFESESSIVFSKTLALSNPQSLASKSLFAVSDFGLSSLGSVVSSPSKLFGSLGNLFSVKTQAANEDDGYRAANFAGIETYDFPPECINLNPLTDLIDGPLNGTNADEILAQNKIFKNEKNREYFDKLESWETHTNSTEFYDTIYNIILSSDEHKENADNIAVTIYNCNLLDNRIRGSLGYPYGYTADNGLEDSQVAGTSTTTGTPNQIPPELWEIFTVAAAKYNISPYALAAIYGYGEHCTFSGSCEASQITWDTSLIQGAVSSAGAKGPFQFVDGTWIDYGDDCDGDGQKEVRNLKDSACGAANYLAASGARGIFDTNNATKLKAAFKNYNHADWYANRVYDGYLELLAGIANSSTNTGIVSGDVQQLAKQILGNPNITYPLDAVSPNGSTKAVLQALANGQKAPVTCSNAGRSTSDINSNILEFLVELGSQTRIGVNALTDKCHSNGSPHYDGEAVDFECNAVLFDLTKGDSVAAKYGGKHNFETCSANAHWHYDF